MVGLDDGLRTEQLLSPDRAQLSWLPLAMKHKEPPPATLPDVVNAVASILAIGSASRAT